MAFTSQGRSQTGQPPADIFDRIDSAVLVIDRGGRVRFANAPAVELLGRPGSEITGAELPALLPPAESFLGATSQAALDGRSAVTTFGWDAFLDTWIGVRVFPITAGLEIHIRTIPAGPVQESRPDIAVPLDTVAIPMLIVDPEGTVQFANQAVLDLLGYHRDDLVGHPIRRYFLQPEDAGAFRTHILAPDQREEFETELLRHDGAVLTVQVIASPHGADDTPIAIQCYLHDVTHQRATEEREARLAALVQSSDDAIISKRLDGIITSWNPGAERMYGYTAEEAVGKPITLIFPDEREDDFPEIMGRLARGQRIDHFETVRRTKDGRLLDISVSISPLRNATGRIVGAATIARDITERRVLERKQREFLTMVAHDLRSPLTSIKGFAQLMQRREAYSPSGVAAILTQVEHMERLVGDVLDLTRIEENRQELSLAEMDLAALAREIIGNAQHLHRAGGKLELNAPDAPVSGVWDRARLAQILDNLVDNAIKYAPDGDITVTLTPGDETVMIEVRDAGPGIAEADLPHIFERFYRSPGEHAMGRGIGLGLTITRGLVEAHGGTIAVESAVGQGTTFRVTLPRETKINTVRRSDLPPLRDT